MSLFIGFAIVVLINLIVIVKLTLMLNRHLKVIHRKLNLLHYHFDIRKDIYQNNSEEFVSAVRKGDKLKAVAMHQEKYACPVSQSLDVYFELEEDLRHFFRNGNK